jgi:hypothetical protein
LTAAKLEFIWYIFSKIVNIFYWRRVKCFIKMLLYTQQAFQT